MLWHYHGCTKTAMVKELAIPTCGLTKQFDQHIAVNNVDLEIPEGEVYSLGLLINPCCLEIL
jgi:ABC-type Fe3+/spermidine/putrescine transport system ATPase subunit